MSGDCDAARAGVAGVDAGEVSAQGEVGLAAEGVEHGPLVEARIQRARRARERRLLVGPPAQDAAHLEHVESGRRLVRHRVGEVDLVGPEVARRLGQQHDTERTEPAYAGGR